MAFKPIEILINAKDQASSVFDKLQVKIAAVGAAILGYFGIQAFAGVVKGAADFEAAMSRVQAATGATKDEMAQLTKLAKDAAASSGFSNVETADALTNLAKAGANAGEAMAALPGVINLARAGEVDLAQSSEFLTKILAAMGGKFSDAAKYADVLAMGANASNTSVTGLAQALSYAAPAAKAVGLSLETTVGILGKFADGGIDASRAGTALNAILSQFLDPASKFRNELALAGITTTDFEQALRQLAAAGPKGANAILAVGTEAGPALRGLLNQGVGALDELIAKLKTSEGSAAATAKTLRDNLNGSLNSLANAWQTVKDVLGTPVLPVLKQAVDELTAAFRAAVADGTVQRFGEAIATAMRNAIDFVRQFVASVNFTDVIARLQGFANEANATLAKVGEYATTAGNTVRIAFGSIQTSGNILLAGLYSSAAGITVVIQGLLQGLELLYRASAKVTFGDLSKQYAEIADDLQMRSEAMGAAVSALGDRLRGSLSGVVDGVGTVRDGFAGLSTELSNASDQGNRTSAAMAAVAQELTKGAQAAVDYGIAAQKRANAEVLAAQAASEAQQALAKLRAEYAAAVSDGNWQSAADLQEQINKSLQGMKSSADSAAQLAAALRPAQQSLADLRAEYAAAVSEGNWQRAAQLQDLLNKALQGMKPAAKDAADAAAQIDAAFGRLGVVSTAKLKQIADASKVDFETIRNSGTATAEDLSNAFKKAAEDAIAANKGIAPSWVIAEAGVRGYKIAVDDAGRATLEAANKGVEGLGLLTRGWWASREAIQAQEDAMDRILMRYKLSAEYTERQIGLLEREAAAAEKAAEAYRKKWNMDKEGYSLNTAGERALQGESQDTINKDIARRYGQQNVDNPDAQRARQLAVLLSMMAQIGGNVTDPASSKQIAEMRAELQALEEKLLNSQGAKPEGNTSTGGGAGTGPGRAGSGSGGGAGSGASAGAGASSGASGGGGAGISLDAGAPPRGPQSPPPQINIVINANGVNDPIKLARLVEPELRRMAALAR